MQLFILLDRFEDLIVAFVKSEIYLAPMILVILEEAGIPIPFTDFAIAYTGYQVSLGHIPYLYALIILYISDLVGVSVLYFLSKNYGNDLIAKYGKYIDLDHHMLDFVEEKIRKFGPLFIIIGRHIPGFKIPITVFSGISKIRYRVFITCVFLANSFWVPFYLSLGRRLGAKTIHMFRTDHWLFLLIPLPVIFSFLPFFLLRKNRK